MSMSNENAQELRKIVDMTRMISVFVLLLHFYFYCYKAFHAWGLTASLSDRILINIARTGLFASFLKSKTIALGFLLLSLLGVRGNKSRGAKFSVAVIQLLIGLALYFLSGFLFYAQTPVTTIAISYITTAGAGYLLILTGGAVLARIIWGKLNTDVFNKENETFPQEERLLQNDSSINLPARYRLRGQWRRSWINFVNVQRGLLVLGNPGSMKTLGIIEPAIKQFIQRKHALLIYDFKYDDLSRIAYNYYLRYRHTYPVHPDFRVINLENPAYSDRCNPLEPSLMTDITDAVESARTIMIGLNPSWERKQGDFFVESPINFVTAIIWFLRRYHGGKYCTLPHAIELMQMPLEKLFTVLRTEPEIHAYINPFISAFMENSMEQLQGQVDGARIGIARLSSPMLYYVLTGNDFTLDINNPEAPKIVCLAGNPQKQESFGPVLSLYMNRINKVINKKGRMKCAVILDEYPTLRVTSLPTLLATARSNLVNLVIALQDFSQLKKEYSREEAEVILNITGNIISGQVAGETAKMLSDRFGRILQERESYSTNSVDTSFSRSSQLEQAVPASTISSLSSGEFVGVVADDLRQPIDLKAFHCRLVVHFRKLTNEKKGYRPLPMVRDINRRLIQMCFEKVKREAEEMVDGIFDDIMNDPLRKHLLILK